jgi:Spy/CpxP family protein refolding chaperone
MQVEAIMCQNLCVGALTAVLVLLSSPPVSAQQAPHAAQGQTRMKAIMQRADRASRWWTRPEVAEKVGVTAEQKTRLDELADATRETRRQAAVSYTRSYAGFLNALSQPDNDPAALADARKAMENDWVALFATSVDQLRSVREILTAEQWATLRETVPGAVQLGQARIGGSGTRPAGSAAGTD